MSSLHSFRLSESEKLKSLLYPWIKNHTILLMAASEPLSAVNLISFSGLISIRRVKPLMVLPRSLAQWKDCSAAFSPPAAFLSTHWVSHYRCVGPGGERLCWNIRVWTFQKLSLLQSCHYIRHGSHFNKC